MKFNGRILVQGYPIQVYYIDVLPFEKSFIFQIYL